MRFLKYKPFLGFLISSVVAGFVFAGLFIGLIAGLMVSKILAIQWSWASEEFLRYLSVYVFTGGVTAVVFWWVVIYRAIKTTTQNDDSNI